MGPRKRKPATTPDDGPPKQSAKAPSYTDHHDDTARCVDKFGWLRAVYADRTFSDGEKAVLAYVAIFDVLNGGNTFCIRQDTIAEHCVTSESTVSRAIRRAKRLGYLSVSRMRKPGWGHHGADELRLTLPESPVNLTANSAESPVKSKRVTRQIDEYIKEYGSLHSSLKEAGAESPVKLTTDPSPPPKCPKHPDGPHHDENCRDCMRWRKWKEQQQANDAERQRQQRQAVKVVIDACPLCDEHGFIDEGNAVRRCQHQNEAERTAEAG